MITPNPAANELAALQLAERAKNTAQAAYLADTANVSKHRKFVVAEIAVAQADATYTNALDRSDVLSIRGVLIAELQAFLALVAPTLAKPDASSIRDQINALVTTGALSPASLATAQARIAATYTACASAFGLVTASRLAASLPAPRPLGSGSAPTTAGAAATELAAVRAANAPIVADVSAYEAELAAL